MAKYQIEHSCGHTQEHQLFGNAKSRQWQEEQRAKDLCAACYRAKVEAERAVAYGEAALDARTRGLPALEGSEKQIPWATRIRAAVLAHLDTMTAEIQQAAQEEQISAEALDAHPTWQALQRVRARAQEEASCRYWIDRFQGVERQGEDLVRDAVRTEEDRLRTEALLKDAPTIPETPLPDLTGTSAQVSYGTDCRARKLPAIEGLAKRVWATQFEPRWRDLAKEGAVQVVLALRQERRAAFWIRLDPDRLSSFLVKEIGLWMDEQTRAPEARL